MGRKVIPGIMNIRAYNEELIRQDEELRERCAQAATLKADQATRMESMMAAQLDALLAIHERLGNLITTNMSNGGT